MRTKMRVLFIGSYPPRECGIATYSQDLLTAMSRKFNQSIAFEVCALENGNIKRRYPEVVKYVLNVKKEANYTKLASLINKQDDIAAVFLQHEFGLFGGKYGEYLLYLMGNLEKPVITTFHTMLPNPDIERESLIDAISALSAKVIVMTQHAASILHKDYDISPDHIEIIPHGTHIAKWKDKSLLRKKYRIAPERPVLATFGLLSENKNIETAIRALPKIKEKFPDVLYLVLGQTHPEVFKNEGEKYRDFLETEVVRLGLEENVIFVNRYLKLPALLDYLWLTDIYLFTSKDKNQAVSGTFAYAMSSACPVVATSIPHTKELLDVNTGILVDFENPDQFADGVLSILSDKGRLEKMSLNAFHKTRYTVWENVAIQTAKLLLPFLEKKTLHFTLPEISLAHLKKMTDDRGIMQFSKFSIPDKSSGYTLDDNARAMIVSGMHYLETGEREDLKLIETYLDFIKDCQQGNGVFFNYIDQYGKYHVKNDYVNLEDANGRTFWALGFLLSKEDYLPDYLLTKAKVIFKKALPDITRIKSPRALAFSINGLYHYNTVAKDPKIIYLITSMADRLADYYDEVSEEKWDWFENYLTYANSTLPEAMLYAYLTTKKTVYKIIARTTFDFLLSHLFKNGQIKVISNNGWFHKEQLPNQFGEQPIDVAYTIQALDIFYKVFKDEEYRDKIRIAFNWFLGNNHLNQIIYNPATGGCYDGLEKDGVNLNQGAESTICYLLARLIVGKLEEGVMHLVLPKDNKRAKHKISYLKKELVGEKITGT